MQLVQGRKLLWISLECYQRRKFISTTCQVRARSILEFFAQLNVFIGPIFRSFLPRNIGLYIYSTVYGTFHSPATKPRLDYHQSKWAELLVVTTIPQCSCLHNRKWMHYKDCAPFCPHCKMRLAFLMQRLSWH